MSLGRVWSWLVEGRNWKSQSDEESEPFAHDLDRDKALILGDQSRENLRKARKVIEEMEAIIEQEKALISDENLRSLQEDVLALNLAAAITKKISIWDKLIERHTIFIGEMWFDPEQKIWKGNEEVLKIFNRKTPSLITYKEDMFDQQGGMIYDRELKTWKGNESTLKRFRGITRPALISRRIEPKEVLVEVNGMIFDYDCNKWIGNDEVLALFPDEEETASKKKDAQGQEFNLTIEMKEAMKAREREHDASLKGWFSKKRNFEFDLEGLQAIQKMAIIKIVHQAKHSIVKQVEEQNDEDWGVELPPATPLKLKRHLIESASWESETDEDRSSSIGSLSRMSSSSSLAKYQEMEEDFSDLDFSNSDFSTRDDYSTKDEVEGEGEFYETSSTGSVRIRKLSTDSSDGIHIPISSRSSSVNTSKEEFEEEFDSQILSGAEAVLSHLTENQIWKEGGETDEPEKKVIQEEDLEGLEIPETAVLELKLPRIPYDLTIQDSGEVEEWSDSDLEIPEGGLTRVQRAMSVSSLEGSSDISEDDWGDLDIPQNGKLELKVKPTHIALPGEGESDFGGC